jgi:predicted  nucleic acid-binding Zn-ribbon protein
LKDTDMRSSIPRRGVQDIRTMTERISDVDNPQRKYLALAMLELERARRDKEKQSAAQRVANINQRLADIAVERTELLDAAVAEAAMSKPPRRSRRTRRTDSNSGRGFKISY